MTLLHRATDAFDLSGDGRTLEGIAVPWDTEARVIDDDGVPYFESFDRRCTEASLRVRGGDRPVFVRHEYLRGSFGEVVFDVAAEGLMFRARAADTRFAAGLLPDVGPHGKYSAVSIGFRPIRPGAKPRPKAGAHVHRLEIALEELSLAQAHEAQHPGAKVLAVRATDLTPARDDLRRRLAGLRAP